MSERSARLLDQVHPQISGFASYLARIFPRAVRQELVQVGLVTALELTARFDPSRGATFPTFSYARIRGAMFKYARKESSRGLPVFALAQSLRDEEAEVDVLDFDLRSEREIATDHLKARIASFVAAVALQTPREAQSPEDAHGAAARERAVEEAVTELPEGDRLFVELFYTKGLTLEEIANETKVSRRTATRMHNKIKKKLAAKLLRVVT